MKLWIMALVCIAGCWRASGDGPSAGTSASSKPADLPGVTIHQDKDGRTKVDGVPLHGDPKTCAAFKKCCAAPDLGLACGLAQAAENGDCAKALASVRAYAKESRSAGCK
jgi:hypothetical protein